MTEYICPNCRGGFDRPRYDGDDGFCPWCKQPLNGEYEPPTVHSISKVESEDDEEIDSRKRIIDLFR